MPLIHLTKDDFEDKKIKNAKRGLIFFSQSWCGWCDKTKPIFEEFSEKNTGYIIDGKDNEEIFDLFGVEGVPDIRMVNADGSIGKEFNMERTVANFKKFIQVGGRRKNRLRKRRKTRKLRRKKKRKTRKV
jgi:thiol-disulfide isomerase/thioredoxin